MAGALDETTGLELAIGDDEALHETAAGAEDIDAGVLDAWLGTLLEMLVLEGWLGVSSATQPIRPVAIIPTRARFISFISITLGYELAVICCLRLITTPLTLCWSVLAFA